MSRNFELMQSAGMSFGTAAVRQRIAEPAAKEDEKKAKAPTVSVMPQSDVDREESLKLVRSLFLSGSEKAPRTVVFAGIESGDGCTRICANAGEALAGQKLGSVCLVDANFGPSTLTELYGPGNDFGIAATFSNEGSIRERARLIRGNNLWLLSCGSVATGSSGLLSAATMKTRLAELRKEFDYVLIDSPPLGNYSDGGALAPWTDGLILVLDVNSTRRETAARVREGLRAAQIKVLGAVLNKRADTNLKSL